MTLLKSTTYKIQTIEEITNKLDITPQKIAESMPPFKQEELFTQVNQDKNTTIESIDEIPSEYILKKAESHGVNQTLTEVLKTSDDKYIYHRCSNSLTTQNLYIVFEIEV